MGICRVHSVLENSACGRIYARREGDFGEDRKAVIFIELLVDFILVPMLANFRRILGVRLAV